MQSSELAPAVAGLIAQEALGRLAVVIASLDSPSGAGQADLRWAAEASGSLVGLTSQIADQDVARVVDQIEARLRGLAEDAHPDPTLVADIVIELQATAPALRSQADHADAEAVALDAVAALAAGVVRRTARRRGVTVALDLVCPEGILVPVREAGILIDVLGQVARDGATHGTREGGAMRMVFAADDDGLVILVSDRGDAGKGQLPTVERNPARGAGLGVAHGRLVAVGGDLSLASGAWGGTSVTVRLPAEITRMEMTSEE